MSLAHDEDGDGADGGTRRAARRHLRHRAERRGDAPGRHRAARGQAGRYAQHQDPRRGPRRRCEAVAPEGHRPRPPGFDPRRRSGAAAVWRTAPSRATTRSAHRRRWCASRCARRSPTGRRGQGRRRRRLGASTRRRRRTRSSCSRRSGCAPRASARRASWSCLFRTDENAWKSLRNLGERVQIVLPEELNTYDVLLNDWLVFSKRVARRPRSPASARRRLAKTRVTIGVHVKDPRDIIIQPVVSEKSYAGYDLQRLHVRRRARRQQDRDPQGGRGAVRHAGSRRSHTINRKGKRTRNRSTGAYNAPATPEAGHRHPRRRRGAHRHLRELTDADSQTQADEPRAPVPDVVRLRRGHQDQAREVAHEAEAEDRWSQLLRPHDVASPRRRSQAALPHRRLQPEQGRRARQGRGDRVRPEPQRAHRAAALPRRREALHHRPGRASTVGDDGAERPGQRRSASATRCRCATSRSARRCTTSS